MLHVICIFCTLGKAICFEEEWTKWNSCFWVCLTALLITMVWIVALGKYRVHSALAIGVVAKSLEKMQAIFKLKWAP